MSFRITGLPAETFADLFTLSDEELATRHAVRQTAEGNEPCRISLTDATPGDSVILVNHVSHDVDTPYRSSFAIYVREGEQTFDAIDEVPEQLRRRMLAVRAFDEAGMIVTAQLVDGHALKAAIPELLSNTRTSYLHVHFATYGCYAAKVQRA